MIPIAAAIRKTMRKRRAREQQQAGEQRSDGRAEVIHRTVEAKRPPALRRRHRFGDHRVARARADALAGAIEEPRGQHVPGRQRAGDAGTGERRERVSAGDEQPPRSAIGQPPGRDLEQARQRVRAPLDEADGSCIGAPSDVRNTGSSGKIASLETSLSRLATPSTQMTRGRPRIERRPSAKLPVGRRGRLRPSSPRGWGSLTHIAIFTGKAPTCVVLSPPRRRSIIVFPCAGNVPPAVAWSR